MSDLSNTTLPQGILPLTDWGVIRARGPEARKFLHSQLTQDVEHLQPGQATLAGYCSAKGRLLASFMVWPDGDEDVLLACSADLLAPTLKRLAMFVLRAKCKLSDATAELPLWGVAGAKPVENALALPDAVVNGEKIGRWLCVGAAPAAQPPLDAGAWAWLEVHSGVPRIVAATVEQFVPQMVNLEVVGGVNFQKGCYPGQEIVARSQYRGTLKRRAYVLEADGALSPGQEIFHSSDPEQPAGMVVLAGGWNGRHAVLAEMKIAATLAPGALSAGGTTLRLAALPYALPAEAA